MLLPYDRGERKLVKVTAAHDYDDVHQLLARLTPDQLGGLSFFRWVVVLSA